MAVVGPLAAFAEPHSYDLCEEHAVRLTVPRGWEVMRHDGEYPSPIPHADDLGHHHRSQADPVSSAHMTREFAFPGTRARWAPDRVVDIQHLALRIATRMVVLPQQQLPDLSQVPRITMISLLLMAAPVAGIVEEAAFRGYMQGPIERRYGMAVAILVTGTMFAVAHLDFTLVLWPYYVAVAAIYGTVTHLTSSILPAIVLHTSGNLYSNFDLWLHGQAEWQAPSGPAALIWKAGADASFWIASLALLLTAAAMVWAFFRLALAARR